VIRVEARTADRNTLASRRVGRLGGLDEATGLLPASPVALVVPDDDRDIVVRVVHNESDDNHDAVRHGI
jgi:hypothetical protein